MDGKARRTSAAAKRGGRLRPENGNCLPYNLIQMNQPTRSNSRPHAKGRGIVVLIACFKLFKATLLILAAVTALALRDPKFQNLLREWINLFSVDPRREAVGAWIINNIFGVKPHILAAVALERRCMPRCSSPRRSACFWTKAGPNGWWSSPARD